MIVHHTTPTYYTVEAICTNDFSQNRTFHGIKATGPLDAVRGVEQRIGREFDRRWDFYPIRSKDRRRVAKVVRMKERQNTRRSPWAVAARRSQGAYKNFDKFFHRHLGAAYACVVDHAMRH